MSVGCMDEEIFMLKSDVRGFPEAEGIYYEADAASICFRTPFEKCGRYDYCTLDGTRDERCGSQLDK